MELLWVIFLFTEIMGFKMTKRHSGHAETTIVPWFKRFRAVCDRILELDQIQIGGPGLQVAIDETFISKCQYGRGRPGITQKRNTYIFGGICRETKELFLVRVNRINTDTLWLLIRQYVARGSHFNSDGAAVYQGLFDPSGIDPNDFRFFGHDAVIHSDSQWMDEDKDGEMVTTNDIEIIWRYLKENISYYRDDGDIDTYVSRYLYFYRFLRHVPW